MWRNETTNGERLTWIALSDLLLSSDGMTLRISDFGVAETVATNDAESRNVTPIASAATAGDSSGSVESGGSSGTLVPIRSRQTGSPAFQPPELASTKRRDAPTFAVDVWACGITLFNMVCGTYPFEGASVYTLFDAIARCEWQLPEWVDQGTRDIIARMLTKDPTQRITAAQLAQHGWLFSGDDCDTSIAPQPLPTLFAPHAHSTELVDTTQLSFDESSERYEPSNGDEDDESFEASSAAAASSGKQGNVEAQSKDGSSLGSSTGHNIDDDDDNDNDDARADDAPDASASIGLTSSSECEESSSPRPPHSTPPPTASCCFLL
jgi:serine/threonine protein kinase